MQRREYNMTKAQKEIRRLEKAAKRTQKQTWADVEKLIEMFEGATEFQKSEFYLRALPITDSYRMGVEAIIVLKRLQRKTQENAPLWKEADATIQRLLQVARGEPK
jgi:hypothetical protein